MKQSTFSTESQHWLCPDLSAYWRLGNVPGIEQVVLQALDSNRQFVFSALEGVALRYFSGQFTVGQVQAACQRTDTLIASDFVTRCCKSWSLLAFWHCRSQSCWLCPLKQVSL